MQKRDFCGSNGNRLSMPLRRDDHHLAGLQIAHEARADDVERAGLRGEDPRAVEVAEHQRADAERIAAADHLLGGQRDQREGAFDLAHRVDEARIDVASRVLVATRCRIVSVSEVEEKIAPCFCSVRCTVMALVRLPLWAMAKPPSASSANSGCTLRRPEPPVVA